MEAFWGAISGTPWWVFALFVYLVIIGYRATRTQKISLERLAIIPLFFTAWSLYGVFSIYQETLFKVVLWMLSFAFGGIIGWLLVRKTHITVDKAKRLLRIPGSWATLALVVVIFSVKYFFGYTFAVQPELTQHPLYYISDILSSGAISGIFVGRFVCLCKKYIKTGAP